MTADRELFHSIGEPKIAATSRRRFLQGLAVTAIAGAAGWSLARPTLVNPCRAALPPALVDSPWLKRVWQGIDPTQLWDCHVHIAGIGDSDSGIRIGPQLSSMFYPLQYAQRLFYMNAGCVQSAPGQVDISYVARLKNLMDGLPAGCKLMLYAFDQFHDEAGKAHPERSAFYVPDAYARRLARENPAIFEWVASIHPYRADAVDALQTAVAGGACAVKWLPAAMGMDPAAKRCDAFYRILAERRLPLIVHCGEEKAVKGSDTKHLGNPLGLRRALDAGVRVVVAHSATLGEDIDRDRGDGGPPAQSFELFARLMAEPRSRDLLYADISAIALRNRPVPAIRTLLEREDWHPRLLYGSDYPLPGIIPFTSATTLAREGLLPKEAVPDLEQLREHNPLYFDFALKRLLSWQGKTFAKSIFETRRVFERGVA